MLHSTFHPGDRVLSRFGMATVISACQDGITAKLCKPHPAVSSGVICEEPGAFVQPGPDVLLTITRASGVGLIVSARMLVTIEGKRRPPVLWEGHHSDEMRFLIGRGRYVRTFQSVPFGVRPQGPYLFFSAYLDRTTSMFPVPNLDCDRHDCYEHGELPPDDNSLPVTTSETLDAWIAQLRDRMHSTASGIAYYCVLKPDPHDQLAWGLHWEGFLCEAGWVGVPLDGSPTPEREVSVG